jgi:hypothetical protein
MAVISTREQLTDYCLRRLGEPVVEINVDEDQIEDKVDDALQVYREFHSDATFRDYYEYQITATDIANRYITVPARLIYVTKLFPVSASFVGSSNMFSFNYQFAMSDFHALSDMGSGGLAQYDQTRSYMELVDMKVNGLPMITFARRQDRLYIWSDVEDQQLQAGDHICLECYEVVPTPEEIAATPLDSGQVAGTSSVYNDMFMKDYTTALIKEQWGINMSKFEGMQLPGGVTINGRQILEDARQELETLRERMRLEMEDPIDFLVG